MCQYNTWFHNNKIGYIVQCMDCKHLQVGFGNVAINLSPSDFKAFCSIVRSHHNDLDPCNEISGRCICIPTPSKGINLLLNGTELNELHDMLETADNEIKTRQLLQLFNK
jgi:hypothetical protein